MLNGDASVSVNVSVASSAVSVKLALGSTAPITLEALALFLTQAKSSAMTLGVILLPSEQVAFLSMVKVALVPLNVQLEASPGATVPLALTVTRGW